MIVTIPVLPLWQPWASAMELDDKHVETRGWVVKHRGLFAVHAAKKWDRDNRPLLDEPQFTAVREAYPDGDDLPLGGIVALALALDCRPAESFLKQPGFVGSLEHALGLYEDGERARFGLVTSGTVRVRPMIPLLGKQQVFFPWLVESDLLISSTGGVTCCVDVNPQRLWVGCFCCGQTSVARLSPDGDTASCPRCKFVHRLPRSVAA